jgi:uncharacterized membrane protein HdeD (DUF308 family)
MHETWRRDQQSFMSQVARYVLIFVVVAVQVGVTILATGGVAFFFAHAALIALAIVGGVALIASLFTEGNLSSGEREDRGNRWVLAAFGAILLLVSFVPPYMDRMNLLTIDGETTRWIGVVLFAAGFTLRLWPVFVLGPGSAAWSRFKRITRSRRGGSTA